MNACHFCHLPMPARGSAATPDADRFCCIGCRIAAEITRARGEGGQAAWIMARLGIAVFLTMSVMVMATYLYGYEWSARAGPTTPAHGEMPSALAGVVRYICLIFATPVFFILGIPVWNSAVANARRRVASTDLLIVLGVAAAYIYSYVSTLRGEGGVYFETACMILVFVTLGRYLETSMKLHASDAVRGLESLFPASVSVRNDANQITTLPLSAVRAGQSIVVPAGQRIAVDGIILDGASFVDEQLLTGESAPVARRIGDAVRAGTLNTDGVLVVRATRVGEESTLGRLVRLLDDARRSKGRYERLADRIASWLIGATIVTAALGAYLGAMRGGLEESLMTALAVLLIACPCSLGIATPLAIWVALGAAAARRVLFTGGEAIEKLACVRTVCFDKTGTLTGGTPTVASFTASEADSETVLRTAAGMASLSTHALSRGIADYIALRRVTPARFGNVQTLPARGLIGQRDEQLCAMGSPELMAERGFAFNAAMRAALEKAESAARPVVCIGWSGSVRGVFALDETLRPTARSALAAIRRIGARVMVLTGDHAQRGEALARELDVPVRSRLAPQDKIRCVEQAQSTSAVAMVGDGLNDAPALAAADVGIALGCGADLTRESADVCLLGDDPAAVPWAMMLARRAVRTIRFNLLWACIYNVGGMGLAVAGKLSPLVAAAAMVVSSLMVVSHSARLAQAAQRLDEPADSLAEFPAHNQAKKSGPPRAGRATMEALS